MISDEALMMEFQGGSREAFAELFARYRGPLYGFFRRRLSSGGRGADRSGGRAGGHDENRAESRAEDLMQETFLAVIRATTRYERRALVRTYLYGIAMNLLAAERRKQLRDAQHERGQEREYGDDQDKDKERPLENEPATNASPEAVLWIRQAMARLDDGEREILMLREYEQLSYAEIAELVKVPVNTVRSRLFRARMALRECLEPGRKPQENRDANTTLIETQSSASSDAAGTTLTRAEGEAM
jgi:RNA polymerase sigma-70 factor, ECF subfamily